MGKKIKGLTEWALTFLTTALVTTTEKLAGQKSMAGLDFTREEAWLPKLM
jgi:hypothetical protein